MGTCSGDAGGESTIHVLLVSLPAQGNLNPMLRLGKRLAAEGLLVTLSTIKVFGKLIQSANGITEGKPMPVGDGFVKFEFFEDGFPDGDPRRADITSHISQIERAGRHSLAELIASQNVPVSCLVNNPFMPWVCDVAEDLGLPCATLWIQSCAVFASFYHYFHETVPFPSESDPEIDVQLPGMPLLKHDEVHSFLNPNSPKKSFREALLGQIKNLSKSFCVFADTLEELEKEVFGEMSKLYDVKPIGPLFKGIPKDCGREVRGDILRYPSDCITWLDSRPASTVVYISFGSMAHLTQEQIDEIAHGVLSSGVSFLWVMKPPAKDLGLNTHELPEAFLETAGEKGKVVEWSPQEEVLAHPAVSCFVTHCGWNSTMEALASGVPMVALPQWGDQVTNAKFVVDVFGVGVRLGRGPGEGRIVGREEVERRIKEATAGEKAAKIRRNSARWKKAAEEAVAEGGPSNRNMEAFIDEIRKRSRGAR